MTPGADAVTVKVSPPDSTSWSSTILMDPHCVPLGVPGCAFAWNWINAGPAPKSLTTEEKWITDLYLTANPLHEATYLLQCHCLE